MNRLLGQVLREIAAATAGCVPAGGRFQLVSDPDEVHDQPTGLVAEDAVDPGDGLHQGVALHRLVHVEGIRRRSIEAGQPHVADDDDLERIIRVDEAGLDGVSQPGQTQIQIQIGWHPGAVTTLVVPRPTTGDAHRLDADLVALIRDLARTRSDDRIAELLNQQGFTTQQGLPWSYRRVMDTRRRHAIASACPITPAALQPRGDGLVSAKRAAVDLHTCPTTILPWAHQGILQSEHKSGTCPLWVRVTPDDVARLTCSEPPPRSVRVRHACRLLHMEEAQFWAEVKAGRHVIYRVRQNDHWEFRVILPEEPTAPFADASHSVSPRTRGALS